MCSRFETLEGNAVLQLDPAVPGVFNGPYPLGIDPVKHAHSLKQPETIASSCFLWSELYLDFMFVYSIKNKACKSHCH